MRRELVRLQRAWRAALPRRLRCALERRFAVAAAARSRAQGRERLRRRTSTRPSGRCPADRGRSRRRARCCCRCRWAPTARRPACSSPASARCSPLDDEYRSFLQLLARQLAASISSARAYEQEKQRAEKLAELDRAKTDFFSNVSHEFRTPLTLILGPVEDALASARSALAGDELELVRRNALRLYKMVNTLLDFSRIEAGRAQATLRPDRPRRLHARTGQPRSESAVESAGLDAGRRLPAAARADLRRPRDVGEDRAQPALQRAEVHASRARSASALRGEARRGGAHRRRTPASASRTRSCRASSSASTACAAPHGRSHEGTGIGLALVHELVRLHGGTRGGRQHARRGHHLHASRCPRGCGPPARRAAWSHARATAPSAAERRALRRGGAALVRDADGAGAVPHAR